MPNPMSAAQLLDAEFLGIRCRLIELAAALDRIDRAAGANGKAADPRLLQIARGFEIISGPGPNRAERLQMAFSLPYDGE
ncbi:MAG: hypothetical protein ABFC96_12020 [Thermoguttaceae bacterium]